MAVARELRVSGDEHLDIGTIATASGDLRRLAQDKIKAVQAVTTQLRMLALNAMIESERVGDLGRGFQVVASEVREIAARVGGITQELDRELFERIDAITDMTSRLAASAAGVRMIDLALNAIEIIDRNLYERTCDVRWWATDSAVVDCATAGATRDTVQRLGVILSAYTVYLDIWIVGLDGRVIASGRPEQFAVAGQDVAHEAWFADAAGLRSGDDYAVADVAPQPLLGGRPVATYATTIRAGGAVNGRAIGVLAVHFDWEPQARAVVEGVRLTPEERARSRVMIIDGRGRVIAAAPPMPPGRAEVFPLESGGRQSGHYVDGGGRTVGFHATPGYETYRGLGWYGVIVQQPE